MYVAATTDAGSSAWVILLLAVISSLGIGQVIQTLVQRRKTSEDREKSRAETENIVRDTMGDLVSGLREEIKRLREEMDDCRTRLTATEKKLVTAEARAERAESLVERLTKRLESSRGEVEVFKSRVFQLEAHMREAGMTLPPWPPGMKPRDLPTAAEDLPEDS